MFCMEEVENQKVFRSRKLLVRCAELQLYHVIRSRDPAPLSCLPRKLKESARVMYKRAVHSHRKPVLHSRKMPEIAEG